MSFDLQGRVAVVTGALGRLGPVWCEALLDAGARVIALDLETTPVGARFGKMRASFPSQLVLLRADVLNRETLVAVREQCERERRVPSILVNNAGIDHPPGTGKSYAIEDVPPEAFRGVFDLNVYGAFLVTQVFAPAMLESRHGSIINIGSVYASVSPDPKLYDHLDTDPPFLKPIAYGASKAALINLTRYLATHWGSSGVRVNALSPGGVRGNQDEKFLQKFGARVPLGRMANSQDLRGPLVFLASDASRYVTGIELRVDGGLTARCG